MFIFPPELISETFFVLKTKTALVSGILFEKIGFFFCFASKHIIINYGRAHIRIYKYYKIAKLLATAFCKMIQWPCIYANRIRALTAIYRECATTTIEYCFWEIICIRIYITETHKLISNKRLPKVRGI